MSGSRYFKVNETDTFSHFIEVKPLSYHLKLSEVPDTASKQAVFGYIELHSRGYYDKRDSIERRHKVQMKFYFRSQYRKFDY